MSKKLPNDLTSYDFLKTFAVLLMIVDHIGYYFYPDDDWWRAVGRLCVPVWFFLIGYARSHDMGARLWIGMGILLVGNMVAGMSLLPVNILGTMLMVRMVLEPVARTMLRGREVFWPVFVLLVLLLIPTHYVTEYGTLGIIMALYGYFCRHREEAGGTERLNQYFLAAVPLFIATQCIYFGFNFALSVFTAAGVFAVAGGLLFFRPAVFPALTARLPAPLAGFFRLGGRRTLEIYVIHLLLFKVLALWLEPDRFILMDWHVFTPEAELPADPEAAPPPAP